MTILSLYTAGAHCLYCLLEVKAEENGEAKPAEEDKSQEVKKEEKKEEPEVVSYQSIANIVLCNIILSMELPIYVYQLLVECANGLLLTKCLY